MQPPLKSLICDVGVPYLCKIKGFDIRKYSNCRGGLLNAPHGIAIVNSILCGFGVLFIAKSLLFYIITLVCLSPAPLRSPDLPERRGGLSIVTPFQKAIESPCNFVDFL